MGGVQMMGGVMRGCAGDGGGDQELCWDHCLC